MLAMMSDGEDHFSDDPEPFDEDSQASNFRQKLTLHQVKCAPTYSSSKPHEGTSGEGEKITPRLLETNRLGESPPVDSSKCTTLSEGAQQAHRYKGHDGVELQQQHRRRGKESCRASPLKKSQQRRIQLKLKPQKPGSKQTQLLAFAVSKKRQNCDSLSEENGKTSQDLASDKDAASKKQRLFGAENTSCIENMGFSAHAIGNTDEKVNGSRVHLFGENPQCHNPTCLATKDSENESSNTNPYVSGGFAGAEAFDLSGGHNSSKYLKLSPPTDNSIPSPRAHATSKSSSIPSTIPNISDRWNAIGATKIRSSAAISTPRNLCSSTSSEGASRSSDSHTCVSQHSTVHRNVGSSTFGAPSSSSSLASASLLPGFMTVDDSLTDFGGT